MENGTLYVTGAICWDCAKVVANSGITRVFHVIDRDRQVDKVENLLAECGVEIWQVPSPHEEIA
jgi:deoxycytidylate deaminase